MVCSINGFAQKNRGFLNLPDYDQSRIHYGFLLGLNFTDYRIKTTDLYAQFPDLLINPKTSTGFSLGLVASLNLGHHFDIRFSPTASFNERVIEFKSVSTGETQDKVIESTIIDLPLMFKFKSQRRNNARVYLLAGLKPSMALATKKAKEENLLRAESFDVALEYGFGLERFYKMFKLAPEVRFSHGLMNVFIKDSGANVIDRLYNHSISIYFFFE